MRSFTRVMSILQSERSEWMFFNSFSMALRASFILSASSCLFRLSVATMSFCCCSICRFSRPNAAFLSDADCLRASSECSSSFTSSSSFFLSASISSKVSQSSASGFILSVWSIRGLISSAWALRRFFSAVT